jgi:DNA-binding transcriptional regulator GbsR (MarR family)
MELEGMFTEQKWNILKCLSKEKYSPLQLAEQLNTTMANISQQLKLLEAVNLVKKEKIKNRDKGKPRTLFSLNDNFAYLISAMNNFADKKLMRVTDHHKIILKIWFLEDQQLHHSVERLYWKIEPYLKQIAAIAVNEKLKSVVLVAEKVKEIEKVVKEPLLDIKILSKDEAAKLVKQGKEPFFPIEALSIIYDKDNILSMLRKRGDK